MSLGALQRMFITAWAADDLKEIVSCLKNNKTIKHSCCQFFPIYNKIIMTNYKHAFLFINTHLYFAIMHHIA